MKLKVMMDKSCEDEEVEDEDDADDDNNGGVFFVCLVLHDWNDGQAEDWVA